MIIPEGTKDYTIKYVDGDNEYINVSDEEDLLTAYDVAQKELDGNLKFVVDLKTSSLTSTSIPDKKVKEKKEKKEKSKCSKKKDKKCKRKLFEEEEEKGFTPVESRDRA